MRLQTEGPKSLRGKLALVTGSSRGIGRGIALRLAERGAMVAVNYNQNESAASDVLQQIRDAGGDGLTIQADVTKPDDVSRMFQTLRESLGALDIFVNNALGDLPGFLRSPLDASLEQFEEAFRSQTRAFFTGVREATPLLRNGGRIIAVSYWPGSHTGGFLPYFAMGTNKAALEAMCRYFAVAFAERSITVNAVCPGITEDSIVNALPPAVQSAMFAWLRSGWCPARRPGTPADIGGAVAALCSADAGWITGQTIAVDGGASLMNPEVPLEVQLG